jgi:hypothetical protein
MNLTNLFRKPVPRLPSQAETMSINKMMSALKIRQKAYSLTVIGSELFEQQLAHDLGIQLANGDLASLTLELLNHSDVIVFAQTFHFPLECDARFANKKINIGQEIPFIDASQIKDARLVLTHRESKVDYRSLLKLRYSDCTAKPKAASSKFETAYAIKTGGRQSSDITISNNFRQTLTITSPIGSKGFGFAKCDRLSIEKVVIWQKDLEPSLQAQLKWGKRFSACLVQTKKGFMARSVKLNA